MFDLLTVFWKYPDKSNIGLIEQQVVESLP